MADKKSKPGIWKFGKAMGILLIVLGIAVCAYSVYTWASFGTRATGFTRRGGSLPDGKVYNESGFNSTGFNQSGFNSTVVTRFRGTALLGGQYTEGIIIGVLLLLLGALTFKYAGLKTATMDKK